MQKAFWALCLVALLFNSLFTMEQHSSSYGKAQQEHSIKREYLTQAERNLLRAAREYPVVNIEELIDGEETNINLIDRHGTSLLLQLLLSTSRRANVLSGLQECPQRWLTTASEEFQDELMNLLATTERLVSIILGKSCLTINIPNKAHQMPLSVALIIKYIPLINLLQNHGAQTWEGLFSRSTADPFNSSPVNRDETESPCTFEILGSNVPSRASTPNLFDQPLNTDELNMLQRNLPQLFQEFSDSFPENLSENNLQD